MIRNAMMACVLVVVTMLWFGAASYSAPVVQGAEIKVFGGATEPRCFAASESSAAVHRAGLVVTFGDGHSVSLCIEFSEDAISGMELLERSGLSLVTSAAGAVCRIDGEGCNNPNDCFCQCTGSDCAYWAYYRYEAGAWQVSSVGARLRTLHDGDVDGWAWGAGGASSESEPDAPDALCPEPTATATAVPTATSPTAATAEPEPTEGLEPTVVAPKEPAATSSPAETATVVPAADATEAAEPPANAALASTIAAPDASGSATSGGATPRAAAETSATATRTPRSGVVINEQEGRANAERAFERSNDGGGGAPTGVIAFGAIAVALVAAAGVAVYWRRRADG